MLAWMAVKKANFRLPPFFAFPPFCPPPLLGILRIGVPPSRRRGQDAHPRRPPTTPTHDGHPGPSSAETLTHQVEQTCRVDNSACVPEVSTSRPIDVRTRSGMAMRRGTAPLAPLAPLALLLALLAVQASSTRACDWVAVGHSCFKLFPHSIQVSSCRRVQRGRGGFVPCLRTFDKSRHFSSHNSSSHNSSQVTRLCLHRSWNHARGINSLYTLHTGVLLVRRILSTPME